MLLLGGEATEIEQGEDIYQHGGEVHMAAPGDLPTHIPLYCAGRHTAKGQDKPAAHKTVLLSTEDGRGG